jgi:hypothetical protein
MPTTQFNTTQYSDLCSVGWRPLLLTGFLVEWMRNHFAASGNIEEASLVDTLWKADNTTNILIESITKWKPELTEKRPAIIIKRNDINVNRLGIDDRLMGYKSADGSKLYTTWLTGSHTLFCIGREGAEVEKLATEVYRELIEFGRLIREVLQFTKFMLQSVGSIFKIAEARETFAVPVTLTYAFDEKWKLVPRAPKMNRLDLALI